MDANNNIRWSSGDQVVAFMKTSLGLKYQILSSSVGKVSASFEKVSGGNGNLNAGTEWDHNVVFYPYAFASECEMSGSNYVAEVCLPEVQSYAEGSFGNGAMPMAAVSEDNDITFRNICGGMKLQLRGTQKVASITLEGKNSERLSGAATVTAYPGETKPAITMSSGASTSVTLDCGEGVQLSESKATSFIIALPPVLFSEGFMVTVADTEGQTYAVETDKANTVLRSSLLVMPAFKLGDPVGEEPGDDTEIPVSTVTISLSSLKLYEGDEERLTARVRPIDATDNTVTWSSDTPSVATVDQTGLVTAVSAGEATITAVAGGVSATCSVTVSSLAVATANYVDEYGKDHGKGISVGGAIWAPVNCGYHETDYPYGKLYQWGRKYGQGYDSDATVPEIREGGVSLAGGQSEENANVFFLGDSENIYDWVYPSDGTLWNSGTESAPVRTEYDPCPEGWRVPTSAELGILFFNAKSSSTTNEGQKGYWFSGASDVKYDVPVDEDAKVFFPAAGRRYYDGLANLRGDYGDYWSSRPYSSDDAYCFGFDNGGTHMRSGYGRASGYSVRCVQNDATLIPVENITLNKSSLTLSLGTSETLSSTITPSNANHRSAHWWSENPEVASVDQNGNVTAVSAGTTTIYAMAGMLVATCEVTVNAKVYPVTGVTLDKTSVELKEGDVFTLVATIKPDNATNKNIIWSSSDNTIASVSNGKVTAHKVGKAIITAKAEGGDKEATCEIKVLAKGSEGNNEGVGENNGNW